MLMLMLMLMRQQLNTLSLKGVLQSVRKTTADVLQSNPRSIEKLFSGRGILERYLAQ